MISMILLSSLRPNPCEIEVAHEVVSAVVVSLANTPLTAAHIPLIAARGIHGSLLVVLTEEAVVGTGAVGGGDGEGSGEEFRSRSAGWASMDEDAIGLLRGSVSPSGLIVDRMGIDRHTTQIRGGLSKLRECTSYNGLSLIVEGLYAHVEAEALRILYRKHLTLILAQNCTR